MDKKEQKRLYDIEYRKRNAERLKQKKAEYRAKFKSSLTVEELHQHYKQVYAKSDKTKKAKLDKQYAEANKDKINTKKRVWALANKEKVRKAKSEYVKRKMSTDNLYKLKHYITGAIRQSLKKRGYRKSSRTHNILGCTYEQFKTYIENLWLPWMNWENFGNPKDGILEFNKNWDLDHIIPISSAITEEDVIKLSNYTNFQPLYSKVNRHIKSNKI